MEHKKQHK